MDQPFWPLLLFAAAMCLTPGPNVVMVVACAANFGFRRSIPQMLGITIGFGAMVIAAGFGLAGFLLTEPQLHSTLRYAAAAYLLYLACRVARSHAGVTNSGPAEPITFLEAMLFTWLNPKGWATTIGALAAFTTAGGDLLMQTSVIAIVLAIACLTSVMIWAGFGTAISRLLSAPRARAVFNWSMAGALALSLIPVFW